VDKWVLSISIGKISVPKIDILKTNLLINYTKSKLTGPMEQQWTKLWTNKYHLTVHNFQKKDKLIAQHFDGKINNNNYYFKFI
jgi:hypothetical protein